MAKKIFYAVLLVAIGASGAWAENTMLKAKMKPMIDSNKITRLVTVQCPAGWTKSFDISATRSK